MKKDYAKYHAWHAKKGTILTLVCSEVNLASVPRNTWWLDSSTTTHINVSMQACLSYRKPNDGEIYIFVGDDKSVEVDVIGTFRLLLGIDYYLDLKDTFVVPSLDVIWFLFLYWINLDIIVHLETISLVFH